MSSTLDLTQDLLRRPSVSPEDHGCIDTICQRLEPLGFRIERLQFGPVENLWARRGDAAGAGFRGTRRRADGTAEEWRPTRSAGVEDGVLWHAAPG
jgi:succinyl-diaminopimelate desuccinylase